MCLTTNNPIIRTAKRDIVCFKMLAVLKSRGTLHAPYRTLYQYRIGERQPHVDLTLRCVSRYHLTDDYVVFEGYHSFESPLLVEGSIFLAVIPKGADYISGQQPNDDSTILPNKRGYVPSNLVILGKVTLKLRLKVWIRQLLRKPLVTLSRSQKQATLMS